MIFQKGIHSRHLSSTEELIHSGSVKGHYTAFSRGDLYTLVYLHLSSYLTVFILLVSSAF